MEPPPTASTVDTPPPEDEVAKPTRQVGVWGWVGVGASIFVVLVIMAGFVIHVPYSTISPGEAVSLTKLVKVDGAQTFPDKRGDIRLLFVRERNHVNLWRYLQARLDDDTEIFKEKELN